MTMLSLDENARTQLMQRVVTAIESHRRRVLGRRIEPAAEYTDRARAFAESFDFAEPIDPMDAIERALQGLETMQVHTTHPGYFGLFNPSPTFMGIIADALVAAFNPQLATHSHAPFPVEVERHLVRAFGKKLGIEDADGTFASGGAEANHTAILLALSRAHPSFAQHGARGLDGLPTMYVSSETHDSIAKAARMTGLGSDAIRMVPARELRMDPDALERCIASDRAAGMLPTMIVATCGTTSAGMIDPLAAIAQIARRTGVFLHVDAAWGGAAALVPALRPAIEGIADADSITIDAHKWLSVPMGAGILITRHAKLLDRTFSIDATYMPAQHEDAPDPYLRSMQWSRRFIGLKLLLSLAVAGWEGYARVLAHQVDVANELRAMLRARGWRIVNDSPLPLVCFVDDARPDGKDARYLVKVMNVVVATGQSWISVARLGADRAPALRACITHFDTDCADLERLCDALERARKGIS